MRALWMLLCVLSLSFGCSSLRYSTAPVPPQPSLEPTFVAGVVQQDITPPPGLALFGHGPEGRIATGLLTRLRCQAFVLGRGFENIALVTCDVAAPSLELQRAVAERVAALGVPIGADRILLMATHTHAGPAHFLGAQNYAGPFGARLPGYDDAVVAWLADRIAGAIGAAYRQRVRACAGWSVGRHHGLTRNRSYEAFTRNDDLAASVVKELGEHAFMQPSAAKEAVGDLTQSPSRFAVDPTLSVLRIEACDEQEPTLMGALAVFGMHPTVIPNTNDLYHGDVFGYAARAVEAKLAAHCHDGICPVVGIANGIEGDVSASWGYQGPREARRLGGLLGGKIFEELERAQTDRDFEVRGAYRELLWPCARIQDDATFWKELCEDPSSPMCLARSGSRTHLCRAPALGTPASGGAEDGPTRLRAFPQMHEGFASPLVPGRCHETKHVLMAPNQTHARACDLARTATTLQQQEQLLADTLEFPALAPISVVRLGEAVLVATPAELTTVVGLRLRQRVVAYLEHLEAPAVEHVIITGLTNNWLQYVTTPEEYAAQHYEGASTLYGPGSERFLSNHVICLTNWLFGDRKRDASCRLGQATRVDTIYPVAYDPQRASRLAPDEPVPIMDRVERSDLCVKSDKLDGLDAYSVSWEGVAPGFVRTARRLRIEIVVGGSVVANDHGDSIAVRHDGARWTARWFPEPHDTLCGRRAQFVIRDDRSRRSRGFTVRCDQDPAPREQACP